MILGFAHLTIAADDADSAAAKWIEAGWKHAETFRDVPSAPAKLPLMSKPAQRHDLVLLGGRPAVEVVAHDTGVDEGPDLFDIDDDGSVILRVRDFGSEREFLCQGLGFKVISEERDNGAVSCLLSLHSRFENWRVKLKLIEDEEAPLDPPLDRIGFSCLAFYSTDLPGDLERLEKYGGRDVTEGFDLVLGNRHISVHMLRGPQGAIFELIKIRGRV